MIRFRYLVATLMAVMLCLLLPFSAFAAGSRPEAVAQQPQQVPGDWELGTQPLPPLEEILARPVQEIPVYGLYTWKGEYLAYRDSIKQAGFRTFRIGGGIDDTIMKAICEDGIEVMTVLNIGIVSSDLKGGRLAYASDEEYIQTYLEETEKFLGRYGPGGSFFKDYPDLPYNPIRYVEILNEPNFQYMIPDREPRSEVEAEREALYAKLLPAAGEYIKANWPDVTVVGFGAGGSDAGDIRFIRNVFSKDKKAIASSFDILSTHPYVVPNSACVQVKRSWGSYSVANSLNSIREIITDAGAGDKPVWYTEIGWPVTKEEGGKYDINDEKGGVTRDLQAAYITQLYAYSMRLGVDRVHIMFTTDTDGFNGGFFKSGNEWRPSAYAVQNMTRLMPNPKLTGAISDGVDGYYAYTFHPDTLLSTQKNVVMAWDVKQPTTVKIPWNKPVAAVVDMYGYQKRVEAEQTAEGYSVTVEVGQYPVYITEWEEDPASQSADSYSGASEWAKPELDRALEYGLITNRIKDNMAQDITREEFAETAVKLYEQYTGIEAKQGDKTFTDTANTEIYKAANLGLVAGVGGGAFAPDELITREQMATILLRALKVIEPSADFSTDNAPIFDDDGQIGSWAKGGVYYCAKTSLMGGIGNNLFDPVGNASREQAVAVCKRAYEYFKSL